MFLRMLAIFLLVETVVTVNYLSEFIATKVLRNTCQRTDCISEFSESSVLACAMHCSLDKFCKRFLVCSNTASVKCSLYYEGENCATTSVEGCSCFLKSRSRIEKVTLCPLGIYGAECENTIKDCSDGSNRGLDLFDKWVRAYIKPLTSDTPFEIVCDFRNGGYTMFMSRDLGCEDLSFNRNYTEYIEGFGDPNGDFWLGLKRIKQLLTNHPRSRLTVVLIKESYMENYYDNFTIGKADEYYPIHLGMYETWPKRKFGDSLTSSVNIEGSPFSAPGSDQTSYGCANKLQAGWWFANDVRCTECSLTGPRYNMTCPVGNDWQYFSGLRVRPYGI